MAGRLRMLVRGRGVVMLLATLACGACNGLGGLGGVLGSPEQNDVTGTVRRIDTRGQQIEMQQSDGRTIGLLFDDRTQVVFQNQSYPVTSLERGDEVTARIRSDNRGGYYTDFVQVNRSVSESRGGRGNGNGDAARGENVQAFQGTVRHVDRNNGTFLLDSRDGGEINVSLPYNIRRADQDRFQGLRPGDFVQFYGVVLNRTRIELRQFN